MLRRGAVTRVVVYLAVAWLQATTGYRCSNRLYNGQRLLVGQSLCSPDGMYIMTLASTGYLMLKDKAVSMDYYVISSPSVPTPSEVSFNASGVLVALSTSGQTYWSTGASGAYLELQNNGNIQLFSRNSTSGQYVVSWTPGLLPLTTVAKDQTCFFIAGGLRIGLQFRVSTLYLQPTTHLTIADTCGLTNIAMRIAARISANQIAINSMWAGSWRTEQHLSLGSSFVDGQVSDSVYWVDQSGLHTYSTRTPSVVYNRNDMNLPLQKYKYLWKSYPTTNLSMQVSLVNTTGGGVPSAPLTVCRSRLLVNETLPSGSRLCANNYVLRAQGSTTEGGIVLEMLSTSVQRIWYLGATPTVQPTNATLKLNPNGSMTVSDATTGFSYSVNLLPMDSSRHGQAAYLDLRNDASLRQVSTSGLVTWAYPPNAQPADWSSSYLGCFKDRSDQRDLRLSTVMSPSLASPITCATYCAALGYPIAAAQGSNKCMCDYSYGLNGPAAESECNTSCAANASFTCGGIDRNAVYRAYLGFNSSLQANQTTQWAASVSAVSSEQASYSSNATLGASDWYPSTGSSVSKTWMPQSGGSSEFIELTFSTAILVEEVFIYETQGAGSVVRISTRTDTGSAWRELWSGPATSIAGSRIFSPPVKASSIASSLLRLELNCAASGGQCAIDAVRIRGWSAAPFTCPTTLLPGDRLYPGEMLCSPNGAHALRVEPDGRVGIDFGQWYSGPAGGVSQYLEFSSTQLRLVLDNGTVAWQVTVSLAAGTSVGFSDAGVLRVVDPYGLELWNVVDGTFPRQVRFADYAFASKTDVLVDQVNSTCVRGSGVLTYSIGRAERGVTIPVTIVGRNMPCQLATCGGRVAVGLLSGTDPASATRWMPAGIYSDGRVVSAGTDSCRFSCTCQEDYCEAIYLFAVGSDTEVCEVLIQA